MRPYEEFLRGKVRLANSDGFDIEMSEINPRLKPHNKLMVKWMVEGGRRACFASFGLHKTVTQLEVIRLVLTRTGGRGLIICPLGVRQEFVKDSKKVLGWNESPKFIRSIEEAGETGIYLTNYETVRDGKLDPRKFQAASLDEASVLRGLGGTKTFREFMRLFTGDAGPNGNRRGEECVPYRFVATATPSPNDYIELLAYADFLGIMDVSQAKTRFFKRNSTKADELTIPEGKEEEFWLWVGSWGLFVEFPSDLTGNPEDDKDYIMPKYELNWHEIPSDHSNAGADWKGQCLMFREDAIGLQGAAKEKRESINARVAKLMELRAIDTEAHRLIWHDQDKERDAIKKAIPTVSILTGSMKDDDKLQAINSFSDGTAHEMAAKAVMAGSGCNFQYHCSWAIYLGIGFKFNDFIQSMHRILRFQQKNKCRFDLIYTEAERPVRRTLERKMKQHKEQLRKMTDIIKKFGLSRSAMMAQLTRKMGVERVEVRGKRWTLVNNDSVIEMQRLAENSVGLALTSIPFGNMYEYSPNYADLGHSENRGEFWGQMDYLTPNVYRALMPGRILAVHVKDRITPGGINGLGFQTVDHLHVDAILHYEKHGFAYMGMKTIVTDVVRENGQTYRLGWSEQCKDGSKMGCGMPEYLLLFRKPPSDNSNAYADVPVTKMKPHQVLEDGTLVEYDRDRKAPIVVSENGRYSRGKWQFDAHGFTRSSGDRLIDPYEVAKLEHGQVFKLFRHHSLSDVYDFEYDVKIADTMDNAGKLPPGFMLLQPQSWHPDVWTDITRMLTLNGQQHAQGKEVHICPMQLDIADRVIYQCSNPDDLVLDFFSGLGTVPLQAVKLGRRGYGIELNHMYFLDSVAYCKAEEEKQNIPTLFDLVKENAA